MSRCRQLWELEKVPSHTLQFRASIMVLQYLSRYSTFAAHKERVLRILKDKQQ